MSAAPIEVPPPSAVAPRRHSTHPAFRAESVPWWLIAALVGLDYFSTLAYLPSIAVQTAGTTAPLAALGIVVVTALLALPVYLYVAGRSPHGKGGIGLVERRLHGWRGKLVLLVLLAFAATDYVVTKCLSIADASVHALANPVYEEAAARVTAGWANRDDWWLIRRLDEIWTADRQVVLALALTVVTLGLWSFWNRLSPRVFLIVAAGVVILYLGLTALVIAGGILDLLAGRGRPLWDAWLDTTRTSTGTGWGAIARLVGLALAPFPVLALGLSGFELSLAVAPLVRGRPDDAPAHPRGRIRNLRKLMLTVAVVMAPLMLGAITVAALLIPPGAYRTGGPAESRALAYLAGGGVLIDGRPASSLIPFFGPAFGAVYDAATIAILCLASATAAIAMHDFVPRYLAQLGMDWTWARRIGLNLRFFDVIALIVIVAFHAQVAALQGAYAASVLVLLTGAALGATLDLGARWAGRRWRLPVLALVAVPLIVFGAMAIATVAAYRSGLEIAATFLVSVLAVSSLSRWMRSLEPRFHGFSFSDEMVRRRWDELCALHFQVLVPHRPDGHQTRAEKEREIRERHRLGPDVPILFVEAELGDPSEFFQRPHLEIRRDDSGVEVLRASRCASVPHVIAAIGLAWAREGLPPEIHFSWSDESPFGTNLNFLLLGQGNIPVLTRELIRRGEPDPARRPRLVIG